MTELSFTSLETWELIAVVIATLFLAAATIVGLWTLFGPEPQDGYRSSRLRDNVFKTPR